MPKTFKHLYPQVCAYENLYRAYRAARKSGCLPCTLGRTRRRDDA